MTTVPVCSNPFNKQKHIKINGLRKPSKKILRNYPSLSAEQLLCNCCRKELSSSKVQFDVYLQAPSTSTVTLEEISPSPVDRKRMYYIAEARHLRSYVNDSFQPGGSMSHQSPQGATRRTPTAPPDSSLSSSLQQQLSPGYPSNLSRSLVTSQRFPRLMHGIGTFGLGGRSGYDFDGTDASKTPSLLDMSEFPSLGNRGDGAMVTPNPTPIRHAYGMFNIIKQQVNMHGEASEFNISSEDFPALPGTAQRNRRASSDDKPPTGGLGTAVPSQPPGLGLSDPSRSSRAPGAERQAAQERGIQTHPDGRVSNIPASMLKDQFGITGLLSFIRVAENQSDLVSLSLGQDLKTLGMNLNSVESVYPNFGGPFAEMPCRPQDIDYHVPGEYLINSAIRNKLPSPKLSMYKEDLLFYFFYNCPGDAIQLAAAVELYNRDWRYHMEEKVNWSVQQVHTEEQVNYVVSPAINTTIKHMGRNSLEQLAYKRLVVPSGMRSIYWKYFGFPGNEGGEIISRDRSVCCLCCKEISYKGNTTNLRAHLKARHQDVLQELELEHLTSTGRKSLPPLVTSAPIASQGKRKFSTGVVHDVVMDVATKAFDSPIQMKTETGYKKLKLDPLQGILNFVYKEMQNPSIVDTEGFKEMIMQVNPNAEIPTAAQVQQLIPDRVHEIRSNILSEIESLTWYSVCVEEWQGVDNQLFFTFVINWAQDQKFCSRTLSTLKWNELTQETVHVMLTTWGLRQEKTVAIVTASAQPALLDILSEWSQVVPCFLFAIQQAVSSVMNTSELQMLLLKCRSLICKHITTEDALGSIALDYPKIWTTTYEMLEEFANRQEDIETLTLTDDMRLNSHDWELVQYVIDTCSPFKVTIQTLQEDEPALVSIIKPLHTQLVANYLTVKSEDNESVRKFKNLLEAGLSNVFDIDDNDKNLEMSAFLDLRFKMINFMDDDLRKEVEQKVKSQMGKVGDRVVEVPTSEPTPTKRLSGMAMLLGNAVSTPPPRTITTQMRTRNDLEMEQFSAEEAVSFETNALLWWGENETKYTQLARIACKYLCVPACVVPAKRINHQVREKFERQRAAIALDMVDMMVFLNGNHK